jgi:hypothetical protein
MWKRRQADPEPADDDVVIDLRERLQPYTDIVPAAVEALRKQVEGEAGDDAAADSAWATPSDWLRAP